MSADYVNDFMTPNWLLGNHAFQPGTNTYVLPTSGGPVISPFGDMLAGTSVQFAHYVWPASQERGSVTPPPPTPPPHLSSNELPISDPPGIRLQLNPNPNHRTPDSRTMYLSDLKIGSGFFLPIDSQLTAEILFDRPDATGEMQSNCDAQADPYSKWGLALVLKSGNQNEYSDDYVLGPSCQFFNGGSINFHGTDYSNHNTSCSQQVPVSGRYPYQGTTFSLSLSIWRRRETRYATGPSLDGNATLSLDSGASFTGKLTMQDRRKKPPFNFTDLDWVNALGVSLVCKENNVDYVTVRLKKFTVSVTPRP